MIYFPPIAWGPTGREPIKTSGDGYALYRHPDGRSWVYLSHWSPDVDAMLLESGVPRVIVSEHWTAPTLEPLRPYAGQIEELALISTAITDLALLADMPVLRKLELHHTTRGVPFGSLRRLEDCSISSPATMGEVCQAPALRRLSLDGVPFRDLRMLEGQSLTSLTLDGKHKCSLDGIQALPLQELTSQLRRLESLAPLLGLPLQRLSIYEGRALRDTEEVGRVATLESLELQGCAAVRSLDFVTNLSALQHFTIEDTVLSDETVSLQGLSGLSALRELRLSGEKHGLRNLVDLECLGPLCMLEKLHIHKGPEEIESIGWVRSLKRLKHFWFGKTRIRDGDVSPLLELPCLERVALLPTWKNYSHSDESFGAAMRARRAMRTGETEKCEP